MSGRRRKKGGHGGEFHADERWLVSYADMITVLMCLFIVLYAMSTVDSHKFDVLKNSLASGFGVTNSKKLDLSKGVPVPKELVDKKGQGFTAALPGADPLQLSKDLATRIKAALKASGVKAAAEITVSDRGVTVGLVGSSTYFDGNAASLKPEAEKVLGALAPVLAKGTQQITVEGHADPHGLPGHYATDWDLASARATAVLRRLVEHGGVAGTRISSISYGSSRPLARGASASAIEHNRRVDIVIHTPVAVPAASAVATPAPATSASSGTTAADTGHAGTTVGTGHGTTTRAEGANGH